MTEHVSAGNPTQRQSAAIVTIMFLMIIIPAAITLHSVRVPGHLVVDSDDPTPYGYTISLLLFIIPIGIMALWLLPQERLRIPRRAFWTTIAVMFPIASSLDFFFAQYFFFFPNKRATLGILAPALGQKVPVEEYIFYLTGFITICLMYIWLNEYWLRAYNAYQSGPPDRNALRMRFHLPSALFGLALLIAAFVYKNYFSGDPGFPGYFTFIVVLGTVPGAAVYPVVRPYINWRAFGVTALFTVLVSLLWEATLALPYGWWAYQPKAMVGIFIGAWSGLPIEAVIIWISVTYANVTTFELIKLRQTLKQ